MMMALLCDDSFELFSDDAIACPNRWKIGGPNSHPLSRILAANGLLNDPLALVL